MGNTARIFVITGPSGVGKGTLIRELMKRMPELALSVSATTRAPRPRERDGVEYHFLDRAQFDALVKAGEFVEHVDYAGCSYGTLRGELQGKASAGVPVVLEIEVQGARQVRQSLPEAILIFIAPPSLQELRVRLLGRGTDDREKIEQRLKLAREEITAASEFTHVVMNDQLERALDELEQIVRMAPSANPSVGPNGAPGKSRLFFTA